ncbi:hypothetical protein Vretimale_13366 [Volvox reticuliferus]|nr:hypothetical protein Vretimale_13366 [Volvox reticuliferus]
MSLASPVVPQHHHYQQQQQHHHHHHHRQQQQRHVRHQHLTMQRALQQQPVESWVEAVGARRGVGDGLPAGAAPGSAWERLLASETQARLMSSRRKLAWMTARDPGIPATTATSAGPTGRQLSGIHTLLGGGGSSAAAVNATTVNTSANEDASTAFPAPPLGPAAQPLLVVLYGLHGLYEELKLDVLSWPLLQPLGISLAAVASMLGLHSYWEHYARDLGPATLVAAGAPEPPLQGPQGLSIRQPSDVYRILGRMVSGTAPEPPELPSLLDPGLTAAAGTAAVGAARAGKTMGSGSAAGTGSGPVVATILPPPFHPVLPLTSRLLACYGLLAECARSCAAILLDTSLQPQKASPGVAAVNSAVQLEAAVRTASEQVVALVVAQNWDAGSLGRLPPGVALPLREAFQRCRASPTPGWPVQAYALIGREDIAATLAPSGLSASGPAATADKRQQEHLHIQNHNQQQLQPPHDTHLQQPSSPQQQQQQQLGQGVAATIEGTSHSALSGSSFVSLLRHLPGLRTSHPGVEAQQGTLVTPTSVTNVDGAARIRESGPKEENVSTVVGGGGVGTTTPSSLFSFRQLPHLSFAAVTPSNSITPHGPLGRRALVATRSSLSYVPSGSSGDGNGAATSTPARDAGTGSAAVPCRPLPPPPPPRPPPSYLWHMWRPAYTARLQLPSHQLDLGAELEAPRKLEGPAKQFESKHGMEGLTRGVSRLRFGRDSRLRDVISALDSSHPLVLDGLGLHESDPDAPMKQQQQLLAAALRTMSLPLGRGAVALATGRPLPTEPTAAVPSMCLAGLVPDSLTGHTVVNLDLSTAQPAPGGGAAADFTAWPEFHNGAAEGLRLSAGGGESLSRTWLHVTTKPDVPSYTHAGLLMALGLTGHLDRLSWTDLYRYLSDEHDPTTIAVLVGMAAQRRASMDPTVTRMLFLHLPARHPTTFPELELSPLVQAAALMGVGLLYEGSAHRVMAETLVEEIGRRPLSPAAAAAFAADGQGGGGPGGSGLGGGSVPGGASLPPGASLLAVTHEREGYALAAGLALGMVVLGLGGSRAAAGLADLQLEERLTYYMLGSTDASAAARRAGGLSGALGGGHFYAGGSSGLDRVFGPGRGGAKLGHAAALWGGDPAGPAALNTPAAARLGDSASVGAVGNGQGAALVVLEPDNMLNLSITSPAATVALALMYLRTNNAAIASRFQLPDTPFGLDCVRPDCITLRALGRALVMWNAIEPSEDWLETSMPPLLRSPLERLVDRVVGQLHGVAMGGTTGRARGVGDGLRGGGGSYHSSDVHAVALAHVSALSGLCLAIGLKYAGSANSRAYETLRSVALALLAAKRRLPEVAASSTASGGAAVVTGAGQVSGGGVAAVGRLDRAPVEAALSVVVLALSVVMAGTGHLPTFHLLQALSNRRHPTHHHVLHSLGVGYGAHCAVSLSLGFLFLGAGTHTFSTTNSAVAALLVALFPTLPHTPTDNRCHLQVFRHLYVLAARQRCLEAVDIDSQQLVYVPLQLTVTPPRVASPALSALAAVTARGNGPTGHDNSADGGTNGDGITGCDPMLEDNTILKASTKANLPWSPDSHLRPGPAGAPVIMGTGAAAGATANGAPGSPPMLEALHLEGDSPGLASLLRATTATATTTAGTTGAPVNAAVPKPSPGSIVAMGSPRVPDYIRAGTSSAAVPPFINMACGLASTATGQPAAVQSQQPAVANGQVMTYERVAPALLPEPHQTIRVAVRGPRYWPQQLDWSSRRGTAVDDTVATASYNMAASASAAPFGRGNAVSSGAPPTAHAAGALGASVPPQTPYGQFPFATPLQGGGAWAGYLNLAGLRTATPPTSVVPAPMATSSPQAATARNIFHNVTRGVLAPTAAAAGGCSALETVYRQLLLFVKKRAGSLSYSQDPSGIRSLLSRAFHNQGLLRMPLELPPPCAGTRSHTAVVTGGAATPLNVAGGAGVSPSSGGNAVFGARRQLDWCTDHRSDRRAAPLGSYFSPCRGGHGGGGSGGVFMEPPSHEGHFDQDQYRADHEDYFTDGSGSGAGNAARTAARGTATVIGNGNRTRGGGGFDLVHLCATFSVDPSIMAFAQHIKAMRDLWSAVEADAEVAIGTGCVTAGGLRRGIVLLAPVSATLPAWDTDVEQQRQLLQWQHCQRRRHGAGLLSFCYSALYECITGEKTAALPMYLNLHCLVHRAASWSSPCASGQGQCHPIEEGLGGPSNPVMGAEGPMHPGSLLTEAQVPLTIALRGLQLARAYYSGPLAAAAAAAAAAPAGDVLTDLDEQALWRPLMQPAFLDSLWCTLQHRRWRPMGLLPSQGATSNIASSGAAVAMAAGRVGGSSDSSRSGRSSSALEVYMRRGRTLQGVDFDSVVPGLTQLASEAELQAELAACLSLHSLPPLATVVDALSQLRALPAWQQLQGMLQPSTAGGAGTIRPVGQVAGAGGMQSAGDGGMGVRSSWALLPLLSLVMPGVSNEGLLLLATAITT